VAFVRDYASGVQLSLRSTADAWRHLSGGVRDYWDDDDIDLRADDRDSTLSYITGSEPGELGGEFWRQLFTFGIGPLLGLLSTLFPSITDFVVSWLQPSSQAIK
jgi:hypothetical protein